MTRVSQTISGGPSLLPLESRDISRLEIDSAFHGLSQQALRGESLCAMTMGGFSYHFLKTAALAGFSSFSATPLNSLLSVALSPAMALVGEVFVYETSHRALSLITQPNQTAASVFSWAGEGGLREGLKHSCLNFALLKSFNHAFRSQNIFLSHLVQDGAMVVAEEASSAVGWTQKENAGIFQRLLCAEAMNFSLGLGIFLGQVFTGGTLLRIERRLEGAIQLSLRSPARLAGQRTLEAFRAEAHGPLFLQPREQKFIRESLDKITAPGFRSGISPERLKRYRDTLEEIGETLSFVEGRNALIRILREDWIEKVRATGAEVNEIRLDVYLTQLRTRGVEVPQWLESFVLESETNASLKVIAWRPLDKTGWTDKLAREGIDQEAYLGFNFGSSVEDQKIVTDGLGLSVGSLSETVTEESSIPPLFSNFRRFMMPEELVWESGRKAHPHRPLGVYARAGFSEAEELAASRAEDAWDLQLTPEFGVDFHNGVFHPYFGIFHDLHVHWGFLNNFPPEIRVEKFFVFRRMYHLPVAARRKYFVDEDVANVLEGFWDHRIALSLLDKFFPSA